eukprot:3382148-Pleurochrysis_carterae.AAC.1
MARLVPAGAGVALRFRRREGPVLVVGAQHLVHLLLHRRRRLVGERDGDRRGAAIDAVVQKRRRTLGVVHEYLDLGMFLLACVRLPMAQHILR